MTDSVDRQCFLCPLVTLNHFFAFIIKEWWIIHNMWNTQASPLKPSTCVWKPSRSCEVDWQSRTGQLHFENNQGKTRFWGWTKLKCNQLKIKTDFNILKVTSLFREFIFKICFLWIENKAICRYIIDVNWRTGQNYNAYLDFQSSSLPSIFPKKSFPFLVSNTLIISLSCWRIMP